jgi:ATP-binding cassette subfamily B protein
MRRYASASALAEPAPPGTTRSDWGILRRLWPYLWRYRWRVGLALVFLLAAKMANVGVPVLLKHLVDALDLKPGDPRAILVVPVGLLAYVACVCRPRCHRIAQLVFAGLVRRLEQIALKPGHS